MMCQCGFINCTTGVQDVNIGEDCTCVRKGGIWELSVLATQFCCEPKIDLIKNKAYFKNIDISAYTGSSKKIFLLIFPLNYILFFPMVKFITSMQCFCSPLWKAYLGKMWATYVHIEEFWSPVRSLPLFQQRSFLPEFRNYPNSWY